MTKLAVNSRLLSSIKVINFFTWCTYGWQHVPTGWLLSTGACLWSCGSTCLESGPSNTGNTHRHSPMCKTFITTRLIASSVSFFCFVSLTIKPACISWCHFYLLTFHPVLFPNGRRCYWKKKHAWSRRQEKVKNVFFNFLILWHFVVNTQTSRRSEVFLIALGEINYFPEIPPFHFHFKGLSQGQRIDNWNEVVEYSTKQL